MRRLGLACLFLPALALTSCSAPAPGPDVAEGPLGAAQSAIAYGTADSSHTAVVALLGNAGGGSFDECSGTIVQVKNGSGYVLTAAHCCNMTQPSVVVMSNDYTVGEQYLFGGTPQPPAYAVTPGSVWYDAQYNGQDHDFCMLKFAAPANAPVIPVAQPGQDGLSLGVDVEHVGFGVTDTTTSNSGRRTATAPVDQSLTSLILQSSQGGPNHVPGVCEGDSGGPALVPAGAAQSQQKVVATTSFGDNSSCAQNTMNVCSRVTSETGPGGFITNYLADTPSGTQAGSAQAACQMCAQSAESGACQSQTQACVADPACLTLNNCIGMCQDQTCVTTCETTAGQKAVNELSAVNACICNTACTQQCASSCGGSTSGCGVTTGNMTCDSCLNASCCSQAQACVADTTCNACLVSSPPASCASDTLYNALINCVNGTCGSSCGGSSTSSSSSSSSSSGSPATSSSTASSSTGGSGPGSTSSSTGSLSVTTGTGTTGTGTTGAGGSGAGGSGSSANGSNQSSGCSVGTGTPASPAPLAGMVLGALLAFSRRRREG